MHGKNSNSKLKVADQIFNLYVSRFDSSVTEELLKEYLSENNIRVLDIEYLRPHRPINFKSFKVTMTKKESEKALKEDAWPEGIVFREYRESRKPLITKNRNG